MNERGDIRELTDDAPDAVEGEILISNKTAGLLKFLHRRQRQRFYEAFKHSGDEQQALNVARSAR
jgi:hypothetical protein